ncbi:uncharacterized protein PHALS_12006 [Plasmopara halstedii]|uniref:Uncharacterized protein n=1 Tax=Plasmopara halstedii TaxID=4781 RepID=A0A0P1AKT8_PLAHL|nr:uncharacterized protein PHALS_12006 [Plasmopara halstedii]CEG41669.1 hypothetical protein PHALS_12006 [Plasmopara halstedii]|eukprot:XP_024578038.1 hypothetical protein PHALS_12006 [Plasmopara halstedii]
MGIEFENFLNSPGVVNLSHTCSIICSTEHFVPYSLTAEGRIPNGTGQSIQKKLR